MSGCNDPALTYLSGLKYSVVRLPRTTIRPLDVIGEDRGRFDWLGPIPKVWTSAKPVPAVVDGEAGKVEGKQTGVFEFSAGLKILEGLLAGFGIDGGSLGAAYGGSKNLQFKFDAPAIKSISPFEVGSYLSQGNLETDNPFVKRFFSSPDCKAYVITEVLLSKSLTVSSLDSNKQDYGIDLPKIQNIVGAKIGVQRTSGKQGEVTYQGQQELTFGFKAYRLMRVQNQWTVEGIDPAKLHMGEAVAQEAVPTLLGVEGWLALTEPKPAPKKKPKAKPKKKPAAKPRPKAKAKPKAKGKRKKK